VESGWSPEGPVGHLDEVGGRLMRDALWLMLVAIVVVLILVVRYVARGGRHLGTATQRASYESLRTANLAAPALRLGLTPSGAGRAASHLRLLLGTSGIVIADTETVVGADNVDAEHSRLLEPALRRVVAGGRPVVVSASELTCSHSGSCIQQGAVVVPLLVDDKVVGALAALDLAAPAGSLRLAGEVAQFVSTQLELAELDRSRERATRAELQFLRAQISPHFVYNALTAIESYVRSDPERARDLLIGFAEFTRCSFRGYDQFTTLADELRILDAYLDIERARFGDRFDVTLRVAPEVLSVRVPSLILQPIVENAVRHGLEPCQTGQLQIRIEDADSEAVISVDDDGAGADPAHMRRILSGTSAEDVVGLRNVDERLRAVFGEDHGLLVETGVGAGTRVTMRIPKFCAAVPAT
jgi:two-component system, LytTR family, sensor kinase